MTMDEKILKMRKARGWSQEELADRIGVTRQAVSRWESGSAKPDADKILAICDLFGVSADYLLREEYGAEAGIQSQTPTGKQTSTPGNAVRTMTRNQWGAWAAVILGSLLMLVIKLVYVFQNTNYYYDGDDGKYSGFAAFLKIEGLEWFWYLALLGIIVGVCILLAKPIWHLVGGLMDRRKTFFH